VTRVQKVRDYFDGRAASYDNPLTAWIGEHELRAVRPLVPAGSHVLDYGCGTGRTTLDLLRRGCRVTAYDVSPAMQAIAEDRCRRRGFSAEFARGESELARQQWPIVTCVGVLDYYPQPVPLLRHLAAYLAPGGGLVISMPNASSPLGWLYALGSRLTLPAQPRTAAFLRRAAQSADLCVQELVSAFPAMSAIGLTLVARLTTSSPGAT
jgi:2-polyprenyl-3-methyl-5-hydroxy-6-metoxy-1,4-benzoquinol methylase